MRLLRSVAIRLFVAGVLVVVVVRLAVGGAGDADAAPAQAGAPNQVTVDTSTLCGAAGGPSWTMQTVSPSAVPSSGPAQWLPTQTAVFATHPVFTIGIKLPGDPANASPQLAAGSYTATGTVRCDDGSNDSFAVPFTVT